MSAQGVAVLLSWLSCCGSALWRYSSNSPNYRIFSTRSTIKLEYEGTSFSEWSVPATCSVKNKSSPQTELRCSSPGIQTIRPIVVGPDSDEERNLSVENSHICFLWYHKVISLFHNYTQIIVVWIYDPENADPDELLLNANEPSLNSKILSKELATLGQKPVIFTSLKKRFYYPDSKMKNGTWHIALPMSVDDVLKEVKGNQVAFQDCFIADVIFLLSFPLLTMPDIPGFLPITTPQGSPLIASQMSCVPSSVVVVADMETFQTNDSFRTWTRIRVPPNILTDDERHNVSDVYVSWDGIFFLINSVLYIRTFIAFRRLGRDENLPDNGISGATIRKWCWVKYLIKNKVRSAMAVWTKNEVYLGYLSLIFVKLTTTEKLKSLLNISPADTLTIQNVAFLAHPLELAIILNYCTTCSINKKIYLVIYNEDTEQWMKQDFALDVTSDTVLSAYFIYSAMPDLLLWDKHRLYYCYQNFTDTGIIQTPTEFGNLSRLSQNSTIHNVFIDYYGNVVVKMKNNIMFYFKANIRDAVKLHVWINSTMKSLTAMSSSGVVFLIRVFENGTVYPQEYPLRLEAESVAFTIKEKCPYVAFLNNIFTVFYFLDKGQNISIWTQIVYPENVGLYIMVESYGPKILQEKHHIHYEIALGYCTKTMTITFFQTKNYEAVDDYFKLQNENMGLQLIHVRPSASARTCPIAQKAFQIYAGCDPTKRIAVKGFNKKECLQHDFFYNIEKSYLRNKPSKNLRVKYDWNEYGCPLRLDFGEKFHPVLQLFNENGYIEDVEVNFIVWEIHGRNDYSFNNTMKKSGCLNEAQTWKSMIARNKHLPLGEVWGPENYKHCFSYAIGKPGDLNQPYEIINKSNYNHLVWPVDHSGMYVFRVKILDPNYSFCNLTTIFAIETFGMIPSPSGYLVGAFLFLLMLLFFTILVLSYFHYMRFYKQRIYETLIKYEKKQKNN